MRHLKWTRDSRNQHLLTLLSNCDPRQRTLRRLSVGHREVQQLARREAGGARSLNQYSDLLQAERSGDRMPVVARFSGPIQNCPVALPTHARFVTPSITEVKEKEDLCLYSPFRSSWLILRRVNCYIEKRHYV